MITQIMMNFVGFVIGFILGSLVIHVLKFLWRLHEQVKDGETNMQISKKEKV